MAKLLGCESTQSATDAQRGRGASKCARCLKPEVAFAFSGAEKLSPLRR